MYDIIHKLQPGSQIIVYDENSDVGLGAIGHAQAVVISIDGRRIYFEIQSTNDHYDGRHFWCYEEQVERVLTLPWAQKGD